jgi:hypothetical protein
MKAKGFTPSNLCASAPNPGNVAYSPAVHPGWRALVIINAQSGKIFDVIQLAIGVSLALAATAAAGFAAPALFGHALGALELVALFLVLCALGWGVQAVHRKRTRRRMMDMRDSALW